MSDGGNGPGGGGGEAAGLVPGDVAGAKDLQYQGLAEIAQGIDLALDELGELGMIGEASAGRGFADLALSGLELGHEGLTSALGSFCERWEWGVRTLVLEGNRFAEGVGLAAGTMHETDQYIEGALKVSANAVMGNPHLSEDQVTQMSWDEIGDNHMFAGADWSGESFQRAQDDVEQIWDDAGREIDTSPFLDGQQPDGDGQRPDGEGRQPGDGGAGR
ncbi:hypothetical protein ACWD4G_33575 [Streptomyces sp. NPDC002643]